MKWLASFQTIQSDQLDRTREERSRMPCWSSLDVRVLLARVRSLENELDKRELSWPNSRKSETVVATSLLRPVLTTTSWIKLFWSQRADVRGRWNVYSVFTSSMLAVQAKWSWWSVFSRCGTFNVKRPSCLHSPHLGYAPTLSIFALLIFFLLFFFSYSVTHFAIKI